MTHGVTTISVFHLHQKYLSTRTYCAIKFLQRCPDVQTLSSVAIQGRSSCKNKLILNGRMAENLLDTTSLRNQCYQTITNGGRTTAPDQTCDNVLVNKPKYSFLKELGIEQHNNGVFNGQWFGSGEVRMHIFNPYKLQILYCAYI